MQIRDWPASERPREKMIARGAGVLSDAELLAIFLGSGTRGEDAVSTARRLLSAHGPLRKLLEARQKLADLRNKAAGNDKFEDLLNEVLQNTDKIAQLSKEVGPKSED